MLTVFLSVLGTAFYASTSLQKNACYIHWATDQKKVGYKKIFFVYLFLYHPFSRAEQNITQSHTHTHFIQTKQHIICE